MDTLEDRKNLIQRDPVWKEVQPLEDKNKELIVT